MLRIGKWSLRYQPVIITFYRTPAPPRPSPRIEILFAPDRRYRRCLLRLPHHAAKSYHRNKNNDLAARGWAGGRSLAVWWRWRRPCRFAANVGAIYTHTYTHIYTYTNSYTYTHTRAHTYTRTHARARTHTYSQNAVIACLINDICSADRLFYLPHPLIRSCSGQYDDDSRALRQECFLVFFFFN